MLSINGVSKSFGGVHALRDVRMAIPAGVITSVIGPNGAGKSTLMNVISGYATPSAGEVHLDGARISGLPPHRICAMGLARSFQNLQMFVDMPAWEVVATGFYRHQRASLLADLLNLPSSRAEERTAEADARKLLQFLDLDPVWWQRRAGDLSYGLQRKLEIGRALATGPRLLLLDEPAAGLNTSETTALGQLFRKIIAMGVTLVLVEHDLDLVMAVSDSIYVLDAGTVIARGGGEEVRRDPLVMAAYLGLDADA
ncbi:ABC transporter ATP-binding protein [Chelatococcus reniformis]|uniref:ABC transporter ATP-binding protein n=1 Tax=Chelatococcus reniformis TaxID=1494448 RepID=A0A916XE21_9HYPH|nr:ABC transporter ATP-binding protein [Chelatococcus reniformis]GGC65019.1 ABC transporter ATP-binding protein [Chelatococcus reniformis]